MIRISMAVFFDTVILPLVLFFLVRSMRVQAKGHTPGPRFRLYLSSTAVLGMAMAGSYLAKDWVTFQIILMGLMISWPFLSAFATFGTPRKWWIFPLIYIAAITVIVHCMELIYHSQWADNFNRTMLLPFGTLIAITASAGLAMIFITPRRIVRPAEPTQIEKQ